VGHFLTQNVTSRIDDRLLPVVLCFAVIVNYRYNCTGLTVKCQNEEELIRATSVPLLMNSDVGDTVSFLVLQ
jgi:hypothetical protein